MIPDDEYDPEDFDLEEPFDYEDGPECEVCQ